jgi:hypothetical protein
MGALSALFALNLYIFLIEILILNTVEAIKIEAIADR